MDQEDNGQASNAESTIVENPLLTASSSVSEGEVDADSANTKDNIACSLASEGDLRMPDIVDLYDTGLRRSKRISENEKAKYTFFSLMSATSFFSKSTDVMSHVLSTGQHCIESTSKIFDNTINGLYSLASNSDSNDIYTFKDMLQQPDKNEFIKAMLKEISVHEN